MIAGFGLIVLGVMRASGPRPSVPPAGVTIVRPPHDVHALAVQGPTLWTGGKDGIALIDRAGLAISTTPECLGQVKFVRALLADADGAVWIGHERGLTRHAGGACTTLTRAQGLPDDRVTALLRDRTGRLWVGTWGGAALQEGDRWRTIGSRDGLLDDMVNAMIEDRDGGMWFGSYVAPRGGVSRLERGRWEHFTPARGLPHANVTSFAADRLGGVWVGTGLYDRGGAARLVRSSGGWVIDRTLGIEDGLAGDKVRSLLAVGGDLWLGSEYDGLARVGAGASRVWRERDGLAHLEVKCLLLDPDGALWVGTRDGVTRFDPRWLGAAASATALRP